MHYCGHIIAFYSVFEHSFQEADAGIAAQLFMKSNKKRLKCGNRDELPISHSKRRKKRYIPRGLSWHKKVKQGPIA